MSRRLAALVEQAERNGATVPDLDRWTQLGLRLALVDRGRFEWLIGGVEAMVAAYLAADPAEAVEAMNRFLESCEPVGPGGN